MKRFIPLGLLAAILLLPGLASAQHQLFIGYRAHVGYTDGSIKSITTLGLQKCVDWFAHAYSNPPAGHAVDRTLTAECHPSYAIIRDPVLPLLRDPLDIGPHFFGIQILTDPVVRQLYPDAFDAVRALKDRFGIDSYIAEMHAVQEGYDLQGFHEEMSQLESELAH